MKSWLPIALPTDEVVPPPIAPPAIININIWKGNTKAIDAKGLVPNIPKTNASANVAIVHANQATILGKPSFQSIEVIGPFKIISMFEILLNP